jgi:hypothetical protein
MTVNATRLRSFIGPVWQEISSLWSGVDFSFYDPLPEPAEPLEQALFPGNVARGPHTGVDQRNHLRCLVGPGTKRTPAALA